MRPISLIGGGFLARSGIRLILACVLGLGFTIHAAAQSGPLCTLQLSFGNGTAPLLVTATGGCSSASPISSESVTWGDGSQTSIPAPSFTAFSIQHTFTTGGTFTVVLAGTDSTGAQTSVSQQQVVPPNAPPTCTLTVNPTSGPAPLDVTATGSCSDPENDINSTTITWGDGANSPGPNGTHPYKNAGSFTVTLTATDTAGNSGSASQTVTVQAPNQPPTCNLQISPDHGPAPLTVTATGSCTDPENDISSTTLNWGDGTTTSTTSGTHTFTTAGNFTIVLTAADSGGLTGSDSRNVKVTPTQSSGPTCALSVSPTSGSVPLTVTANGNCSDPTSKIVGVVLNWGDGTTQDNASGTHTYSLAGSYTVTINATDAAGLTGTATQAVTAGSAHNAPPQCSISASPANGQVPFSVTVNPNCTDPENDISTIVVDFGDGFYTGAAPGAPVTHTFTFAGQFQITVTASDTGGKVSAPSSQNVSASDTPTMFVGVSNGQIKQFDESGKALRTLNTSQGGTITGMAFDSLDSLYVTDFTANAVTKFDGNGTPAGNFGSGYNCQPESIVFDNAGNAYVGETGCSHALLKLDAYGNLTAAYGVTTEAEGSDWIDIAPDQCTIYYTSQGKNVFRFNACTGQQEGVFATDLNTALAVRVLADGTVLAANQQDIVHLDSGGNAIGKYTASGENCWVSLALDPDGKSFWAVDYCSSDVAHFDIASGNLVAKFNSGAPPNTVYGIGMRGPAVHLTPAGPLIPSPQSMTVAAGQSASYTLAFMPSTAAAGQSFTFSCANLPVGASCQFSPQSAAAAAGATTVHLTITTNSGSAAALRKLNSRFLAWWVLIPGVLFIAEVRRGSRRHVSRNYVGLLLAVLAVASMLACSGSTKNPGTNGGNGGAGMPTVSSMTPASTYGIVVRATSNSFQSSTVVNLTVQ
ncbi:MAG TPA: PKD domain-containing protein [Terriglobales bacterium]|nr:PKD domain-containing protein [Terriglobales bacterium]